MGNIIKNGLRGTHSETLPYDNFILCRNISTHDKDVAYKWLKSKYFIKNSFIL